MMKHLSKYAAALILVLTLIPPTAVEAWRIGPGICTSSIEGVTTLRPNPVRKRCSGHCLTSIKAWHDRAEFTVVDFKQPGYDGEIYVAVLTNDSRLGYNTTIIGHQKLQEFDEDGRPILQYPKFPNWRRFWFTGLKPEHYYNMVIYGEGGIHTPFERKCFLTSADPAN